MERIIHNMYAGWLVVGALNREIEEMHNTLGVHLIPTVNFKL